jgi:hypothetical protein
LSFHSDHLQKSCSSDDNKLEMPESGWVADRAERGRSKQYTMEQQWKRISGFAFYIMTLRQQPGIIPVLEISYKQI